MLEFLPQLPVIVISRHGNVETAVHAYGITNLLVKIEGQVEDKNFKLPSRRYRLVLLPDRPGAREEQRCAVPGQGALSEREASRLLAAVHSPGNVRARPFLVR